MTASNYRSRLRVFLRHGRTVACWATAIALGSFSTARPQSNGETVIRGHYVESHYLMEGEHPPIEWTNDFTLSLSGANAIHEEWKRRNNRNLNRDSAYDYTLGSTAGSVSWRVLGPNKLQKTIDFRQHTLTLTISTANKECRLEVGFTLKPGFKDVILPRADTGVMTHFSLPRVLESSCSIS